VSVQESVLIPSRPTTRAAARLAGPRLFLQRIARKPGAFAGLIVILLFLVTALLAPYLAPHPPTRMIYTAVQQAPTLAHPFGTDELGRDVLSRVIYGARISMQVGVIAVGIALTIGTLLGLLAGFAGGWADAFIMRAMDVMLAFPGILLAIAIVAVLGPGLLNAMIAVGIAAIPVYARTARASTLSVLELDYVQAAGALGARPLRIALKYVLPNISAPIVVLATVGVATSILSAAGLSYLGLGAQPPTPEWGAMLSGARSYLRTAWWMATFPGLAIMLVVMAFNLLGDGLRDLWDPRLGK
jgi:peptide/nickel transport system permease protein